MYVAQVVTSLVRALMWCQGHVPAREKPRRPALGTRARERRQIFTVAAVLLAAVIGQTALKICISRSNVGGKQNKRSYVIENIIKTFK